MANVASPFGFRPVRYLDGTPYNGALERCSFAGGGTIDAFIGTPVVMTDTGDVYTGYGPNAGGSYAGVEVVAGGNNAIYGIVMGFEPQRSNLELIYLDASAVTLDLQVMVAVAVPNLVFEVEVSTALTVTGIGAHHDHTDESAVTGTDIISNCTLEVGGAGQWRMIGFKNSPDNDSALDNAIAYVVCIRSQVGNEAVAAAV